MGFFFFQLVLGREKKVGCPLWAMNTWLKTRMQCTLVLCVCARAHWRKREMKTRNDVLAAATVFLLVMMCGRKKGGRQQSGTKSRLAHKERRVVLTWPSQHLRSPRTRVWLVHTLFVFCMCFKKKKKGEGGGGAQSANWKLLVSQSSQFPVCSALIVLSVAVFFLSSCVILFSLNCRLLVGM